MEINCQHVWREVSNYLDGEVDADLRAAIEEHVRGCKHCTAVLNGTRNVLQLVGDERVMELPMGFENRLQQRLNQESPSKPKRKTLSWLVWAATAATLALAALMIGSPASSEPHLRAEMSHPAAGIPADLVVYVAPDGKTFHIATCSLLHDKAKAHGIPASEALKEGYAPCVHCMKQYLSARLKPTNVEELADLDILSYQNRRTP
jgi:predicted anti-sigma-YlaC factor YlaD